MSLSIRLSFVSPRRRLWSVSACNRIPSRSQILSQFHFHLNRRFKRHRIQMLIKFWHQSHPIFPHNPSRFIVVFVIFESVIDRESSHPNIDAGLERIALGIQPQNRRMLCHSIAQQNHVNVMMKCLFLLKPCSLRFQHVSNASPLHFGRGAATSIGTGRVKCLRRPQAVHFQESDLRPVPWSTDLRAESARSRIGLSAAISGCCAESINSAPCVEACE
jgi:hypothetical protein